MEKQKLISTINELNIVLDHLNKRLDKARSNIEYFSILDEIQVTEASLEDLEDDLLYYHKTPATE